MKRLHFVLFLLFYCHTGMLHASSDSVRFQLSFCPQYLLKGGFKPGADVRVSSRNWVSVSPEFFSSSDFVSSTIGANSSLSADNLTHQQYNQLQYYPDELRGFGITLEDKFFFDPQNKYSGYYIKGGFNYTKINISFQDYTWQPYVKNNITYEDLTQTNGYLNIEKFEVLVAFGRAFKLGSNFRADFALGLGNNIANSYTNLPGYRNYDRDIIDYQYNGAIPIVTFQIGYAF